MQYLQRGNMPLERFQILVSISSITSENIIAALEDHLCKNMDWKVAAALNGVPNSNFSRGLSTLNGIEEKIERIKEMDWQRFGYVREQSRTETQTVTGEKLAAN